MKDGVDVGFLAHPSFVSPEELTAIKGPVSIAAAEFDNIFPAEKRHETEQILSSDKITQPFQINLFSGVHHGFAVRGDLSNKQAKYAKEQAFLQATSWFDQFLKE
jgi:dienelactone hydrolase